MSHRRWLLIGCRVATAAVCAHLAFVASLVGTVDRALWGIDWADARIIGPFAGVAGIVAVLRPQSDRFVQFWIGALTIGALGRTWTLILVGSPDYSRSGELRTASAWLALWVCGSVVALGMWTMATLANYQQRAHAETEPGDP